MATENARASDQDVAHLVAWVDEQRRLDHDQIIHLARAVEQQRETLHDQGLILAQLRQAAPSKGPTDIRLGDDAPSRLAEHLALIDRSLDDHIQAQSRVTQADASLRDRDRRTLTELVQQVEQLNRTLEAATGRLNGLSEEIRHERDARAPFFQSVEEVGRTLSLTQNKVSGLEQSVRRMSLAQAATEQLDEKHGADLPRLDNQVKLLEIRYSRDIAEIRRLADEWKAHADEQLRPIEGVARQIVQLGEHRDTIMARLTGLDQALADLNAELFRLEATETSDRAAIDHLEETTEAQARRWETTGASIWQLGERLTAIVDDLSQLRAGERLRREEIDALGHRLDRVDEDRRRLETALAESNASIHAVDRNSQSRADGLTSKVDLEFAALTQRGDGRYRLALEHLRRTVDELQQQYRELDAGA